MFFSYTNKFYLASQINDFIYIFAVGLDCVTACLGVVLLILILADYQGQDGRRGILSTKTTS